MIKIPQPAIAFNSHDVPDPEYSMLFTWKVPEETSPLAMMSIAAMMFKAFKDSQPDAWLTLVINCHGTSRKDKKTGKRYGGYGLSIGTGIHSADDVEAFGKIEPYVDRIYLVACRIAAISNPGDPWKGDGNLFCGAIAKKARAEVVASTAAQSGFPWIPPLHIDDMEGTVYTYGPDGSVLSYTEN